jgi:hypothetical protein
MLIVTFARIIFVTSISTPWNMAFSGDSFNIGLTIFDSLVNIMFLCDIILQFFTAYYDIDYNIVDQRKVIIELYHQNVS